MRIFENINLALLGLFIKDYEDRNDPIVRAKYGLLAGWTSIVVSVILFIIKIVMGIKSGSISVVADAFHLLSHLANSIILVITFWVTLKPATAKTPFGHGRMEHIGPLIMSIFLFVSGINIGERSLHQALHPEAVKYWAQLPWILLATVFVKWWMGQFILFLGKHTNSRAILTNAGHQQIEAISTLTVIAGLLIGHFFHINQADGYIGIAVSIWLLYLGYTHAYHAIIPLLGKAPDREMIRHIRESAKEIEGIEDIHEIIVHDYGSIFFISFHGEIPEKYGPARIHEIAEKCEAKLRGQFKGEVVCHTDPLLERTPEVEVIEKRFKEVVTRDPRITGYHDFRVIKESEEKLIIVADIDVEEEIPESKFEEVAVELEKRTMDSISNLAYCSFYVTPKFAY